MSNSPQYGRKHLVALFLVLGLYDRRLSMTQPMRYMTVEEKEAYADKLVKQLLEEFQAIRIINNDFVVEGTVLKKYIGTDSMVNDPDGLTAIDDSAFEFWSSLEKIIIPRGIEVIGKRVFYQCEALETVVLPEGLSEIGEAAFAFCSSLSSINVPSSLKKIGMHAFCACKKLSSFPLPKEIEFVGEYAFVGCPFSNESQL